MTAGELMNREINEQPDVLRRVIRHAADSDSLSEMLRGRRPRFVLLAARGTSDHAALYAKYLVEVLLGIPAGLVSPSTTTVYGARPQLRDVLFLAISQSGSSPDLVEALGVARDCGAATVAVTNDAMSPLAAAAEHAVDVHAGSERAVAATKTYTAQLLSLYLLLAPLGGHDVAVTTTGLADKAEATLSTDASVTWAAERYRAVDRLVTCGRGFSYPTAREAALKLMETSYVSAQAFSGADLLHGPLALVDRGFPVIAVMTPGRGGDSMAAVLARLVERGADVLTVGAPAAAAGPSAGPLGNLPVQTAGIVEELHPLLEILPLQQLACRLALLRGEDPDSPRGLAKKTTTW